MSDYALEAEDLTVTTRDGLEIVSSVDLAVARGHLLGLLGETGAGKTVTARAILGLLPPGLRATGRVRFGDHAWLPLHQPALISRELGRTAGLMLQNPMNAFDPLQRVGPQLTEAVVHNRLLSKTAARDRAAQLCQDLGLGDPDRLFRLYPHQLSGGMSQRAALALTLMPAPQLVVVDEPTSALDANLRVDALTLIQRIARDHDTAVVLVSHDLGLVSRFCDTVAVLYAGHIAETGTTADVLHTPAHPYTRTLISCSLRLDGPRRTRLPSIGGEPPMPGRWPDGCFFHPRCPDTDDRCRQERPALTASPRRAAACHFARLEEPA